MFCCSRSNVLSSVIPMGMGAGDVSRSNVEIVEAKESGLHPRKIQARIVDIHNRELAVELGSSGMAEFLENKYFGSEPILKRERVWIAKLGEDIIGYAKGSHDHWDFAMDGSSSESHHFVSQKYRLNYLAIDGKYQEKGVGTRLMLHAMTAAKEMGYKHLCVEYLLHTDGNKLDSASLRRENFYEKNFHKKFEVVSGREERDQTVFGNITCRYLQYNLDTFSREKAAPFL